jgi:hypothetical protein
MRVLIFLAALLVAPAWADDELIPDPETLAVAHYEDGDGYVLLTFRAVTGVEGLTGCRIYHEILISSTPIPPDDWYRPSRTWHGWSGDGSTPYPELTSCGS